MSFNFFSKSLLVYRNKFHGQEISPGQTIVRLQRYIYVGHAVAMCCDTL